MCLSDHCMVAVRPLKEPELGLFTTPHMLGTYILYKSHLGLN